MKNFSRKKSILLLKILQVAVCALIITVLAIHTIQNIQGKTLKLINTSSCSPSSIKNPKPITNPYPNTIWKTFDVETISPKQVIDYLYWTNRSSCGLINDFGGIMMTRPRTLNALGEALMLPVDISRGIDGQYPVCLDEMPPPPDPCLVYSFGINNEWSFDDTMEAYGCQVYSFDASMKLPTGFNRSPNIHFYDLFISSHDNQTSKSFKLSSIYNMLKPKHGKIVIDYLKIDIENNEWDVLPDIVQSGMLKRVRQFAVEIHLTASSDLNFYRRYIAILKSIEDAGMVRFDSKYSPFCPAVIEVLGPYVGSVCFQIAWYNSNLSLKGNVF